MGNLKNSSTQTAAAVFFDSVARNILAQNALPDLRGATILLPNYHSARPLAQALSVEACLPALLLPRMVTLSDWAQSISLDISVQPDTQRITALYQALRERRWFADADLWSLSRELLGLMDDLTRHHVALPESGTEFAEQLAQAYRARSGQAMQFEARVVHELWYAMATGGELAGELDSVRAYQQRLAQLAQRVDTPLYVLLTSDLAAPEAHFLEACRARVAVTIFDLRKMVADAPACALLSRSLQHAAESADLRSAAALLKKLPDAALSQRLRLFGAHSLEQEARAAEVQVRRWLLAGRQNIALVAQDRLVARRVRALLERAGVLVRDETGWTMSTLAVSTVLMRWLDALQSDFYYQDLLDLLKSPFIFADLEANARKQAVYQLEQLVRKHGVASHLDAFFDLAHGAAGVQTALARLRQAAESLRRGSDTLGGWLRALDDSLSILGVLQGLAADEAGAQLLQALHTGQQELAADNTRFSRAEWRRWLAQQLDAHTFRDTSIDSPVLLTHLAATRWRSFDAVLLLGADAAHLPGTDNGSLWFNDAVRSTLGLPTRENHLAQQRDDLLGLLAMNDTVLATWQSSKSGEKNLLSPHLEMLRALHELAYGDDLADKELAGMLAGAQVRAAEFPLPEAAAMPAPVVPHSLIPERISASGYNSLVACPYQYFARHMLRLNELDEVREGVEKRDYGEWAHDILHRFHQQFPLLGEHARAALEEALQHISSEVFAPAVERDYLARAWLLRWQQAIPAYLDVQLKGEAEGWRYQNGEVPFEMPLTGELTMHGRIDRVDARAEGAVKVLDYKMMDAIRLRNKLREPGEDVQLACYARVYEAGEAAFISIEKDKVAAVAPPQDVPELAQANIERLLTVFAQLRTGAAMPAHGVDEACVYCEMRGLCRKSDWETGTEVRGLRAVAEGGHG
ncbi:MAG: putative superfamily I helicase fused with RecB family exonuclease [Candidatus Gallionella acididurans]|uniref:Putative superfamily I helicase fused with RecB family exonuclease n=1 Tax=Candidatus Gallionella acididurans TaxID=1796491 RepID=A0A139BXZ9_9PROT|nr:MAG: putative superfamily I helicase fused with RecB family exonuclease [Candidatus Gallionella acididurans]